MQSAEGQAGGRSAPSVSGASENVQEGIDSAADTVKEGTRQAQEYAAEQEKVNNCLALTCVTHSPWTEAGVAGVPSPCKHLPLKQQEEHSRTCS